ncbi:MAG: glycerate kinase [Prolixibacteraceae bacterium]|nr:glycerate kinase [Prolixibacteraceae bacterium]
MRIVIAPDSFKECLTATRVAESISEGIRLVFPNAEIIRIPFADGGEGTVEALVTATSGRIVPTPSVDALNRPIQSFYGVLGDGKTAVIEMAATSGLEKLSPLERNPLITSTFGTGLLIEAAMEAGFRKIILGIGGSATNDGGAGMAQALGFGLLNQKGKSIGAGGGSLTEVHSIHKTHVHPFLRETSITVACDVRNTLLGNSGATRVFGPQKGATPEMIETLEINMTHFAGILFQEFGINFAEIPGSGAAGGLGAGLMAFCNAKIVSGFELISQLTHLEEQINQATLVFTGEGKIDSQTAFGKTVSGVAKLGRKYAVPVIALAGIVEDDLEELYNQGITSVYTIGDQTMSPDESIVRASELLTDTTTRILRNLQIQDRK